MPSPVPSFMGHSSYGSPMGPMPCKASRGSHVRRASCSPSTVYYPETQSQRHFSNLGRTSMSQPPPSLSSSARNLVSSPENREAASRKRKRHASPEEAAPQAKMRVRKSRLPGMPGSTAEDVHLPSGPVDMFAAPPPVSSAYVPEYFETTATSRPPTAPYQEDYQTSG